MEDRHVDLLAKTRDPGLIQRSEKVLIVSVDNGVAEVTQLPSPTSQSAKKRQRSAIKH